MPNPTHQPAASVAVYSFRPLDDGWETTRVSPFKATREAITRVFVGDVLEGTREHVSADEIDALGRWRRVPTAWGELR
jgi:hypothetical protein